MNYDIEYNGERINFTLGDLDFEIEIDKDISIDYSNIVGDMAYTTLLANKVGTMKSELERRVKSMELDVKNREVSYKLDLRKEAASNGGVFTQKGVEIKNTEKALEKAHYVDTEWIRLSNELYKAERDLSNVNTFFWELQSKIKRLELPLTALYPEDMSEELIADKFNKLIKKKVK